jgi:hypothetical protein
MIILNNVSLFDYLFFDVNIRLGKNFNYHYIQYIRIILMHNEIKNSHLLLLL